MLCRQLNTGAIMKKKHVSKYAGKDRNDSTASHNNPAQPQAQNIRKSPEQTTTGRTRRQGVQSERPKVKVPLGVRMVKKPAGAAGASGAGSGSFPFFVYNGGPVVQNPQVYTIFLGDWSSTANQNRATRLNQFLTDLMNSPYMNILSQYGCGSTGTFNNGVFIANSNHSLVDSDLHTFIQNAINNNTLPEPAQGSSIVYAFFLDDSTGIVDGSLVLCEASGDNTFGYHNSFTTTAGNQAYYAVVPGLTDTCLTNSCPGGNSGCSLQTTMTQEQRQTKVLSHEFSEMISDPEGSGPFAWQDFTGSGENGDICNFNPPGTITVGSNTWTVQPMYSKWDDMQSNGATTCILSSPSPLPSLLPNVSLILDRSTFGKDEVSALISAGGGQARYTDAFYVVLYGFSPDELQLTASNLTSPPNLPTFSGSFTTSLSEAHIAFDSSVGVQLEDVTNPQMIQNIVFPFNITFTGIDDFTNVPANPGFADYQLTATVTLTPLPNYPELNVTRAGSAEFELVLQADPYMMAGETWWLSNDMRVFSVTPATLGPNQAPLQNSSTLFGSDPNTYMQNLIDELNTFYNNHPTTTQHPFDTITDVEDQAALDLSQNSPGGQPAFNFALARVHLQGDTANTVRAFFRLFISSSPDTTYDQSTTFRRHPQTDSMGNDIPGTVVPLLGFVTNDMPSTIPFFAAPRIDSTSVSMTRQPDPKNIQTIPDPNISPAPAPGSLVTAYFGCYLDINQPTKQFPVNPSTASTTDGPWNTSEIQPIPSLIMGNHACLVTEIAYDSAPIPAGANASNSDKLGQRNLAWGYSDNPGSLASHSVPNTFSLQPAPATTTKGGFSEALMIEWGNTPAGSVATIYWPQVAADSVLELASLITPVKALRKVDANTIQCTTGNVTFIPVPANATANLAGLITIDLPSTVVLNQEFNIVVRRIRSRFFASEFNQDLRGFTEDPSFVNSRNWRYVAGAFQIRIPVSKASLLLRGEENLLAVFKWKLEQIPATNKWYPVLSRYVDQIIARVNAFGGNGEAIPPSLIGFPDKPGAGHLHEELKEYAGKISSLSYDRFGDFEKFNLLTEAGHELVFHSHEFEIERLVRFAWEKRVLVTIFANRHQPFIPVTIVLRRFPLLDHWTN